MSGNDILKTYFGEEIPNGILRITMGKSTESETLQGYIEQGEFYAMLANNEANPLTYDVQATSFVKGNLSGNAMQVIIGTIAIIAAIICIYIICKFKVDGLISVFSTIAGIALLAILIRGLVKMEISLNSMIAIIVLILLNAYLIIKMLNKIKSDTSYENVIKATLKVYLENIEVIIITLITAIVFAVNKQVMAYSFGMTLFYGIISIAISNLLLLRTMLLAKYSNK